MHNHKWQHKLAQTLVKARFTQYLHALSRLVSGSSVIILVARAPKLMLVLCCFNRENDARSDGCCQVFGSTTDYKEKIFIKSTNEKHETDNWQLWISQTTKQ